MENISGFLFALQLRGANVSVFLQISSRTNLKLSFGGIHQTPVQFRQYLQSKRFHPTFQRPDFNILIFSPLNLQSSSIRDGDYGECPSSAFSTAHDRFIRILDGLRIVDL